MSAESLSSNCLTAMLLVEIPKRFPGARCWRNNVGSGLPIAAVRTAMNHLHAGRIPQALGVLSSRPVHFGIKGQADISGVVAGGRRLEVEVKVGPDRMREDQEAFRAMILRAGGIHVIARDLEQAIKDIEAQL